MKTLSSQIFVDALTAGASRLGTRELLKAQFGVVVDELLKSASDQRVRAKEYRIRVDVVPVTQPEE